MKDIASCKGSWCVLKHECLRYTAPPTTNQTYADFDTSIVDEHGKCLYFIDNGCRMYKQHRILKRSGKWQIISGRHRTTLWFDKYIDAEEYIDDQKWRAE